MNFGALRGLNDPLSVYNEAIYTFYRTLKRWTTETLRLDLFSLSLPPKSGGGRPLEGQPPPSRISFLLPFCSEGPPPAISG